MICFYLKMEQWIIKPLPCTKSSQHMCNTQRYQEMKAFHEILLWSFFRPEVTDFLDCQAAQITSSTWIISSSNSGIVVQLIMILSYQPEWKINIIKKLCSHPFFHSFIEDFKIMLPLLLRESPVKITYPLSRWRAINQISVPLGLRCVFLKPNHSLAFPWFHTYSLL